MGKNGVFFLLVIIGLLLLDGEAIAQQGCVTAECHSRFQRGQNIHPEDVMCGACHLDVREEHIEGTTQPTLAEEMCSSCHEDVLGYQYMHAPVEKGECHLCHNPHGDIKKMFLPKEYSTEEFINYSKDEYTFCFSCHKRDLLMFPDTSFSTGFRDGLRNLHYLHVNKAKRGRNCKFCHAIHGADQPKMMADIIAFGNWQMPLNFQKTDNGGSCAPGCHRPQQYDRKNLEAAPMEKNDTEKK